MRGRHSGGYRALMTDSTSHTEPEDRDLDEHPEVDAADAGLPSSPELDDDNVVVTPPDADDVPGSAAG
jgi:hypothetical protein